MKQNYKSYFKTTPMGKALQIKCEAGAIKQEEGIEQIFKGTRQRLSPSDVLELYPAKIPITSVRRAITQMTKKGVLVMTEATKLSEWGKPEHLWLHSDFKHLI
jgi:hypothetical protein